MLLDAGADPNLADANGVAPYVFAAQRGHVDAAKLLLKRGAKDDLSADQQVDDSKKQPHIVATDPPTAFPRRDRAPTLMPP